MARREGKKAKKANDRLKAEKSRAEQANKVVASRPELLPRTSKLRKNWLPSRRLGGEQGVNTLV